MSIEKITKFAKHFDLLILHEKDLLPSFFETAKEMFNKVYFQILDQPVQKPLQCHLLIICGSADALKTSSLRTASASIQRLETVIFTPDVSDVNVYKSALSIRSFGVSEIPQSTDAFADEMTKIFPHLIKKHNESIAEGHQRHIAEQSNYMFCIYKNGRSLYANDALKHHLNVTALRDLDVYIDRSEIGGILKTPGSNQKVIPKIIHSNEEWTEYLINTHPLKDGETLIGILPLKIALHATEKRLLNRMSFIELLKDAFVIHDAEKESIPVVMIHIENSEKIIEHNSENTYNDICKEMLLIAQSHFGEEAEIAQWYKDVYTVISPGTAMEDLKQRLEQFHKDVSTNITVEQAVPVLDSFVIDMHGVDLNKAISIIDHIHQKNLLSADISNLVHHEISATRHEQLDDGDQAIHYLEKLMLNKSPVKLLNFYKGIRISTTGRLVKLSEGLGYVAIEKMQGYAMKLEQNTVIQAANMPYDLQANVKIVDVSKKIAVLSHFQPLRASANNRQYTRIQSDHRMHVTVTSSKSVMAGSILDISIKSIACKVSSAKIPPEIGTPVVLQFNLPQTKGDEVMVSMNVSGKIQYVQKDDEFTKVVVVLELEEPYESYLIEYIYHRQQALINEIKTIANKF